MVAAAISFNHQKDTIMAENVTCPEIKDILSENECLENFGGLGVNVYVFIKSDLAAPLSPEAGKNTYAALTAASFKKGKGLYKFECQDGGQGHTLSLIHI